MVFGGLGVLVYGDIPEFGQIGLQDAASPIMEKVIILHDGIMLIVLGIVSFVLWLIIGAIMGNPRFKGGLERERNVYSPYFIDWSWVEIL